MRAGPPWRPKAPAAPPRPRPPPPGRAPPPPGPPVDRRDRRGSHRRRRRARRTGSAGTAVPRQPPGAPPGRAPPGAGTTTGRAGTRRATGSTGTGAPPGPGRCRGTVPGAPPGRPAGGRGAPGTPPGRGGALRGWPTPNGLLPIRGGRGRAGNAAGRTGRTRPGPGRRAGPGRRLRPPALTGALGRLGRRSGSRLEHRNAGRLRSVGWQSAAVVGGESAGAARRPAAVPAAESPADTGGPPAAAVAAAGRRSGRAPVDRRRLPARPRPGRDAGPRGRRSPGRRTGRCRQPLPVAAGAGAAGKASRSLRTTGASMVEDGDFTNSPISVSFAMISLLVLPSSFASSCTRALPATALLTVRAGGRSDLPARPSRCAGCCSLLLHGVLTLGRPAFWSVLGDRLTVADPSVRTRPGFALPSDSERNRRTLLVSSGSDAAQCPAERPTSLRAGEATGIGMQPRSPTRQALPGIGNDDSVHGHDAE